jgi:hypothetical protein
MGLEIRRLRMYSILPSSTPHFRCHMGPSFGLCEAVSRAVLADVYSNRALKAMARLIFRTVQGDTMPS